MTTELVLRQPSVSDWAMIQSIAASAKDSMKFGLAKPQEAEMKLLVAWENGFPLTSAFGIVHIINGISALSPKAVWAKVVGHPEFGGYQEERLEKAGKFFGYKITLKRKTGIEASRQFTLEDAVTAKLDKKDNWLHFQENMCYWRAMGHIQDVVFPDVTLGLPRADMLGADVDADGDVIEGSWSAQSSQATAQVSASDGLVSGMPESEQPAQPDPVNRLNEMVQTYGVDAIMAANNNKIPATNEELDKIERELELNGVK